MVRGEKHVHKFLGHLCKKYHTLVEVRKKFEARDIRNSSELGTILATKVPMNVEYGESETPIKKIVKESDDNE